MIPTATCRGHNGSGFAMSCDAAAPGSEEISFRVAWYNSPRAKRRLVGVYVDRFFGNRDAKFYVNAVAVWEMRSKNHARRPTGARKSPFDSSDATDERAGQGVTFLPTSIPHSARELT